jgi:hypothetical protein
MITGCFAITNFHPLGVISDFSTQTYTDWLFFTNKGRNISGNFLKNRYRSSSAYLISEKEELER